MKPEGRSNGSIEVRTGDGPSTTAKNLSRSAKLGIDTSEKWCYCDSHQMAAI